MENKIPVEKNKEYIVEIIDNGFEGEGIAKIEGYTIFVPGAIKKEKCKILIVKVTSSHAFGKIIEIIEKASENTQNSIENKNIEKSIMNKQNEIVKLSNYKMSLYEDWKNEYITKEEYLEYKNKYEKNIEELKKNIEILEKEKQKYERQKTSKKVWLENFKENKKITQLSRVILLELINSIYVHEDGNITIKFNFEE